MNRFLLSTGIMLASFCTFAQEDLKIKKKRVDSTDNDIKLSVLPYYNFGRGLGMTSPDSLFQLNIRFRMQNRAEFGTDEDGNEGVAAHIRRLRLRFDGYVGNPKFLYAIQLSFAPDDVGEIQDGGRLNVIRDAVIYYRPNDNWNISFGQTKLPGNRQRINSSGALQLTDRSINNAKFNLDRDFGIQLHNLNSFKNRFSYNLKGSVTTGNGRNTVVGEDSGLSYTGKIELFPLGAFTNSGSTFEGDIEREDKVKVMISTAYNYNDRARKSQGVLGSDLYEKRSQETWLVDAMMKYQGVSLMYAFMKRDAKNPLTQNAQKDTRYVYVGQGSDFQLSYLFRNNYEMIGRYSYLKTDQRIKAYEPNQDQFTIGLTKYIWEHAFKLQLEGTYNQYKHFAGPKTDDWYTRFQIEMGI